MSIIYTRHALSRMRWRKISKAEIEEVITLPDQKENIGFQRFHYFKAINNRYLRITLAIEDKNFIIISAVQKKN